MTPPEPLLTHGRHCPCSACERQDWTDPNLASCGMHGPSCPAVYRPSADPLADIIGGPYEVHSLDDGHKHVTDADGSIASEPQILDAPWSDGNGDEIERGEPDPATPPEPRPTLDDVRQWVLDVQARWMLSEGDEADARCGAYDDVLDFLDAWPHPVREESSDA